jgi:hypothetical protein
LKLLLLHQFYPPLPLQKLLHLQPLHELVLPSECSNTGTPLERRASVVRLARCQGNMLVHTSHGRAVKIVSVEWLPAHQSPDEV